MARERDFNIDLIRVIIIMLVVLAHTIQEMSPVGASPLFLMMGFGLAQVFIMASGAMVFPVRPNGREFLKRRILSVVPRFVLWSLIYVLLACLTGETSWSEAPFNAAMMFFVPTFRPAWFIMALLGFYLIAPVISPWVTSAKKSTIEKFLAFWLLSGFLPLIQAHTPVIISQSIFANFFSFAGFAVMGYYLKRWPLSQRPKREVISFFALMLFLWLVYGSWFYLKAVKWGFMPALDNSLNVNFMAYNTLVFAVLLNVRCGSERVRRFVTTQSRYVYVIFLSHMAVLKYVILPLLSHVGFATSISTATTALTILVAFIFTFIGSYMIARLKRNHR